MNNEKQTLDSFLKMNPLAFEIIGLMLNSGKKLTITEISNALERKQPSVHRVLQRLIDLKLAEKEPAGKFTYYTIPDGKKEFIKRSIHAQTRVKANIQPPLFMLLSIESGISRILSESLEKEDLTVTKNQPIAGKNFDHEFDVIIEGKNRIVVEIISIGDEDNQQLFEIAGRLADLPKTSINTIVLVIVGHLHQSSLQYLKNLNIKGAPQIEIIILDETLSEMNEKLIKRKVVAPIEKLLK
ncbi:MAG: MarR family transcriptional regulator [Candidatus Bathyarchaeota archaeon]|nr:MarR family transcriptional regulator [Candidatus Termiticorpusculum sp.]